MLCHYRHGTGTLVYYCVYRYRPRFYMSQVLSVAPRTDTPCRPWTSHYIVAVSANLKDSLYVTKETSIILFQLGAVDILTFSRLRSTGRLGQTPPPPLHSSPPLYRPLEIQWTCTVLNLLFHWSPLICTSIVFRDRGVVMWQSLLSSQLIKNNLSKFCCPKSHCIPEGIPTSM